MQPSARSLEPEWAAAATEVKEQTKGKVKLAAVDATVNQVLASRYGVSKLSLQGGFLGDTRCVQP